MTTRHLVDPELLALIDAIPFVPLNDDSLADLRQAGKERFIGLPRPAIDPARITIPASTDSGAVQLLHYRPRTQRSGSPALLHFHGGGMISGQAEISALSSAAVALKLDIAVFSVDYRLAPETRFPGQVEDAYAALTWLKREAGRFDVDPALIAVSGDSAGGGLAAMLALMTRDRGEFALAAQILTYPMLDWRTGGPNDPYDNPQTGEFAWTRQQNRFAWEALRGDYGLDDNRVGWFSPALAADLSDLPPTWIGVGMLDLFRDECEAYARRLDEAGVPTTIKLYPGAPHAFNAAADSGISRQYRADLEDSFGKVGRR